VRPALPVSSAAMTGRLSWKNRDQRTAFAGDQAPQAARSFRHRSACDMRAAYPVRRANLQSRSHIRQRIGHVRLATSRSRSHGLDIGNTPSHFWVRPHSRLSKMMTRSPRSARPSRNSRGQLVICEPKPMISRTARHLAGRILIFDLDAIRANLAHVTPPSLRVRL